MTMQIATEILETRVQEEKNQSNFERRCRDGVFANSRVFFKYNPAVYESINATKSFKSLSCTKKTL